MLGIRIFGALALLGSATLGISDVHAQQSSLAIKGTCAHNFRREWNNVEIVNDFVQALNKHDPVAAGRFVESDTSI